MHQERGEGTDIKMGGCADAALWRLNEVGGVVWLEDACTRNVLWQLMQRKEQPLLGRRRMVCGLTGGLIVRVCLRQESRVPWNASKRLWTRLAFLSSASSPTRSTKSGA